MNQPRTRTLSKDEKLDWLRLIRSDNVGPITFRRLLERFGTAGAALDALPELARHGGRAGGIKVCPRASAEREMEGLEPIGARLVAWGEPEYQVRAREASPDYLDTLTSITSFVESKLS